MRSLFLSCCCVLVTLACRGQRSRMQMDIMPELAGYAQLNQGDISREGGTHAMNLVAKPGGSLGLALRFEHSKVHFFVMPSIGLRMDQQQLDIAYGENATDQQKFTNLYVYLKPMVGFSIPLGGKNGLDIGAGFCLNYSLKSRLSSYRLRYMDYNDPQTGATLSYPAAGYYINWGGHDIEDGKVTVPIIFQAQIQLAYVNRSILPKGKPLRIGVEFATRPGDADLNGSGNEAKVELLDRNRSISSSERYWDRYTTLGINLAIGL